MDIMDTIAQTSNFKSIEVEKDVDVEFDVGNMAVSDSNAINEDTFRADVDECLRNVARGNAQLLITQLWKLPAERVEDVYIVKLPAGVTRLPREKRIPAAKKATKWETFAKLKGIQKTKKARMVWDEELKEYRPRWGYNRINDETKDWCLEVPDQADPNEDQFEKRLKAKKERVAKNEFQRLRNLARNKAGKMPGLTMMPTKTPDKQELKVLQTVAKTSTASLGKFTDSLPKEKPAKNIGKKRKFESNFGDLESEKKRAKAIFEKVKSGQALVDSNRAANLLKAEVETSSGKGKDHSKKEQRRSKHGKNRKDLASKKGSGPDKGHGSKKGFGSDRGRGFKKGFGSEKEQGSKKGFGSEKGQGSKKGFGSEKGRGAKKGFGSERGNDSERGHGSKKTSFKKGNVNAKKGKGKQGKGKPQFNKKSKK